MQLLSRKEMLFSSIDIREKEKEEEEERREEKDGRMKIEVEHGGSIPYPNP